MHNPTNAQACLASALTTLSRAEEADLLSAEQEARRCGGLAGVSNDFHL